MQSNLPLLRLKKFLFTHDTKKISIQKIIFDLAISTGCFHNLNIFDLKFSLNEIKKSFKQSYIMVESYRNEKELFNLQCWALNVSFFPKRNGYGFLRNIITIETTNLSYFS